MSWALPIQKPVQDDGTLLETGFQTANPKSQTPVLVLVVDEAKVLKTLNDRRIEALSP